MSVRRLHLMPFTRKLNNCYVSAGLLTYSIIQGLPVLTVAQSLNNTKELTATGIAPDLHRIPY